MYQVVPLVKIKSYEVLIKTVLNLFPRRLEIKLKLNQPVLNVYCSQVGKGILNLSALVELTSIFVGCGCGWGGGVILPNFGFEAPFREAPEMG